MDARHGSLPARTVLVLLACALALPAGQARADTAAPELQQEPSGLVVDQPQQATLEPSAPAAVPPESVVVPQDPAPAVIVDGGGAQPEAEVPVAAPAPPPELQAEREPQAEPDPGPASQSASTPGPAADVPNPIPAAPEAPKPEARVAPSPAPPARDKAIADARPRLLAEVDVRLRRVEQSLDRVKSQLDAGRAPADSSVRELRQNFEGLAPAVAALERYMASHPSHGLDTGGVVRRLRRTIAGAVALVAEVARSGAYTPESALLVEVLERFAGAPATVGTPGHTRTGTGVLSSGATGAHPAYTYAAPASPQSPSGIASEVRYAAATVSSPRREHPAALNLPSLTQLGGPAASTKVSLGLAALALLLALAVSASLSSFLLSGWGLGTSTGANPGGRPPGIGGAPSPGRRTSTRR